MATEHSVVSPFRAGLTSKCPRCGEGALFDGFLRFHDTCPNCGLSYAPFDTGDGPAVFVIFVVSFIVVALAAWVEIAYQPPYWIHIVLWLPLISGLGIGLLRPFKATLAALQYVNKAAEARLDEDQPGL